VLAGTIDYVGLVVCDVPDTDDLKNAFVLAHTNPSNGRPHALFLMAPTPVEKSIWLKRICSPLLSLLLVLCSVERAIA
jgi:hypothetical protein